MAIIGNPIVSTDFPKDTFSGNGSTTAFTMQIAPASVNSVIVVVSGITQDPSTYTISGTTLTFSAAPPTGTSNISVRHLGIAGIPNTPSANSVGPSAINSSYSLWNLSGSDINYTAGNVLVGSTTFDNGGFSGAANGLNVVDATHPVMLIKESTTGTKAFFATSSSQAYLWTPSNVPLLFGTNDTERMRIDTSGDIGIGVTNPGGNRFVVNQPRTGYNLAYATHSGTTPYGWECTFTGAAPNNASQWFFLSSDTSALRFVVMSNGGFKNYSANNVNLSDETVKKDITLAGDYLDKICAIPVKTFLYIDQTDTELNLGVIAQDVHAVAPELTTEADWGTKENPEIKLSVYESDLMFALMKSIQELNAKVDAQALEIAALKGTV
jgi:hypothetical protein